FPQFLSDVRRERTEQQYELLENDGQFRAGEFVFHAGQYVQQFMQRRNRSIEVPSALEIASNFLDGLMQLANGRSRTRSVRGDFVQASRHESVHFTQEAELSFHARL